MVGQCIGALISLGTQWPVKSGDHFSLGPVDGCLPLSNIGGGEGDGEIAHNKGFLQILVRENTLDISRILRKTEIYPFIWKPSWIRKEFYYFGQ